MSNEKSPTWKYVLAFAQQMEHQLSRHRDRGDRPGWMSDDPRDLVAELIVQTDKVKDLAESIRVATKEGFAENSARMVQLSALLTKRTAHAANFAMMVADRLGALDVEHLGPGMLPPPEAPAVERSAGDAPETAEQWKNQTLRLRKELSAERERCADLAHELQQAEEKARELSDLAYERKRKLDEARSDLAATGRSLDDANAVAIEAEKQVAAEKAAHAKTAHERDGYRSEGERAADALVNERESHAKTQDLLTQVKNSYEDLRSAAKNAWHVLDEVLP